MTPAEEETVKQSPPVRFLGFSGPLMIFSDSKLLIENQKKGTPMKQFTPVEEEAYVRARWNSVRFKPVDAGLSYRVTMSGAWIETIGNLNDAAHAAFLFTKQREAEIHRREISIGLCKECLPGDGWHDAEQVAIAGEIIAREQADLAELRRGWKGEA